MLILLNKNKIYSCFIAIIMVGMLFSIGSLYNLKSDVDLTYTSTNIYQENYLKIEQNNNVNKGNNY